MVYGENLRLPAANLVLDARWGLTETVVLRLVSGAVLKLWPLQLMRHSTTKVSGLKDLETCS